MSKREVLKAQDVFESQVPVFGGKCSFAEAFPEIERIEVKVIEIGTRRAHMLPGQRTYDHTSLGEFINCTCPQCYNGGFAVGALIRDMVANGQTEREDFAFCRAYKGSQKGQRSYGPCRNEFRYKISITRCARSPGSSWLVVENRIDDSSKHPTSTRRSYSSDVPASLASPWPACGSYQTAVSVG